VKRQLLGLAYDIFKYPDFQKKVMAMIDENFKQDDGIINNDFVNLDLDELEGMINPDKVIKDVDVESIKLDLSSGV
jgi:hypothetical protein